MSQTGLKNMQKVELKVSWSSPYGFLPLSRSELQTPVKTQW